MITFDETRRINRYGGENEIFNIKFVIKKQRICITSPYEKVKRFLIKFSKNFFPPVRVTTLYDDIIKFFNNSLYSNKKILCAHHLQMQRVKSNDLLCKGIYCKESAGDTNRKKYIRICMSMNRTDEKFHFIPFPFFVQQTQLTREHHPKGERNFALGMKKFSSC